MPSGYKESQQFSKTSFTKENPPAGEYEDCDFVQCDLSGMDLSGINFTDCRFVDCNLSNVPLRNCTMNGVHFKGCKLSGVHFNECNPVIFDVSFEHCNLTLASFYKMKMKKCLFRGCTLHETDLTEADLTESVWEDCDLSDAVFEHTCLEKADLRGARDFRIDPTRNKVGKARFGLDGLPGLLGSFGIRIG